ncbi:MULTISPECIES: dihydroneopterin aldolase [unclassified Caballeronia]|uniref:dihydroneopterin aldolase n=1 Tax=unclassified Caballeronia TaxID=2646786 RepID=UPI00285F29A2|nr:MULTISPECIES: dihydroneopterin aldolase [unclassified Caballeronia]MDR5818594.1 dihydroneopterin aldolase [Caballeronia sp. LZ033]MDR5824253.1 dihydroneopterin aldolase [Caballeronia sp. LZ043]MDR5838042.1 dihydroneopterin aldolase [Caballeronia sp. LZ034LL]MDR5882148.1 dihydroneopterin aldolase [Caballeronia sp. LZ032]
MKPFEPLEMGGRGWRVVVDELIVQTRVGLYEHEHEGPQPVCIDASLHYRAMPDESDDGLIDYEAWCNRVSAFLETKPHTRLLETLAVEIAALSFDEWPALDALTLTLHKPKIRPGTKRLGLELDWRRADHEAWRLRSAAREFATP